MPDGEGSPPRADLFAQVAFHVVPLGLRPDEVRLLRQSLTSLGGNEVGNESIHNINGSEGITRLVAASLTHVIATTIDFPLYELIEERFVNVVRPDWVFSAIAKGKLPNPRQFSADPRMIFSGLVVHIASDIPEGEKDALIGGLLAMGGMYAGQMSRQVTHVVALSMQPNECALVMEKRLGCSIVLPHWFDDCLRLSKRIDEAPYTLPNPALFREDQYKVEHISRPDLITSMYTGPGHLPKVLNAPDQRTEDLVVFAGRKVLLANDLPISKHLRATIEDLIKEGGGKVAEKIDECDTLVCQWREGFVYRAASQEGKTVGNLSWLYHIVSRNKWTSPLKRLLHYPLAKDGIPGFHRFKLSLSNYSGESRVYLENLAKAAGSTFTKAFKTENTHLITAHERSEKVDAAKEWNIPIVNHLWLEECYASWTIQKVTDERFTYMPPKTNMSEVVGQTPIDVKALEKHFYPKPSGSPASEHIHVASLKDSEDSEEDLDAAQDDIFMTANGNETVEDEKHSIKRDEDELSTRPEDDEPVTEDEDELSAKPTSAQSARADGETSVMQEIDHNVDSGDSNKNKSPQTPAPQSKRSKLNRPRNTRTPRTPAKATFTPEDDDEEKENEAPRTIGRSAKAKAAEKLQSMAPDIELFNKEMKRKGGVLRGGKRDKDDVVPDRPPSRKRSASQEDGPAAEEDSEEEEPDRKKAKGPPAMRLMITGWGSGKASEAKAALRNIGIMLTEDAQRCTHLAAAKILRTKKFICALASAPTIVDISFVEESLKQKKIVDVNKHLLKDRAGESQYDFKLSEAIERSKQNKRKLLRDMHLYVTPDVYGGYDQYQPIIRAHGGTPLLFQGRPGAIPSRRAATDSEEDEEDEAWYTLYLLCEENGADEKLQVKFREMAEKAHWKSKVIKSGWLLDSTLSQELRPTEDYAFD